MLTTQQSERVDRYLARLDSALSDLPEPERRDVVEGVREHIEAALSQHRAVTDSEVERVLTSLGDPMAIAAEAQDAENDQRITATPVRQPIPMLRRTWVPAVVVATLFFGMLATPVIASFGGVFLVIVMLVGGYAILWASPLWTLWEKIAGTLLLPAIGPMLTAMSLTPRSRELCASPPTPVGAPVGAEGVASAQTCSVGTDLSAIALAMLVTVVVAASVTAFVLYRRGRARAARPQSFSTGA